MDMHQFALGAAIGLLGFFVLLVVGHEIASYFNSDTF